MGVLTEIITVNVKEGCSDNPVYLCWLNTLGGFNYWLFNKFQEQNVKTSIENSFSSNVSELETALGIANITGKSSGETIEVGSSISIDDMDGIKSLYESTSVFMLANPLTWETDGVKWKRVIVQPGSLMIFKTNKSFYDIKLNLVLPERFTQQQ